MTAEREKRVIERFRSAICTSSLLEQYAPPSIVVNENYDIVHLSERAGRFLQVAGGEPSKNLLKMIRPGFAPRTSRRAVSSRSQKQTNVEAKNLKTGADGRVETINIHVRPVLRAEDTARGFLLVFRAVEKTADAAEPTEIVSTATNRSPASSKKN
jgi:two-component system CheB/CheR fusion protein